MSSITATGILNLSIKETLTTSVGSDSPDPVTGHLSFQTDELTASTTVPATIVVDVTHTLSGGALTVDLTSLTGTNGSSVTASGLKLQYFTAKCPASNTGALTLTTGSVNGFSIDDAAAAWLIPVHPGGWVAWYGVNLSQDVAGGDLAIDLSGTSTDTVDMMYVFG